MTPNKKPNLALFDFDGTITHREMFSVFMRYCTPSYRKWIGNLIVMPFYFLYRRGAFSPIRLRRLSAFLGLAGRQFNAVNQSGERFAKEVIPHYLRDNAMAQLRQHQAQGDVVVVVSASLDVYLSHWCQAQGVMLLCNELKVNEGYLTGTFKAADCSNHEKVNKIKSRLDLADFNLVYAYGDTDEDGAMLDLADEKYMNWQKCA